MASPDLHVVDRGDLWNRSHLDEGNSGCKWLVWASAWGPWFRVDVDDRVVVFAEEAEPDSAVGADVGLVGVSHIHRFGGTIYGFIAQLLEISGVGRGGDADDGGDRGERIRGSVYLHIGAADCRGGGTASGGVETGDEYAG